MSERQRFPEGTEESEVFVGRVHRSVRGVATHRDCVASSRRKHVCPVLCQSDADLMLKASLGTNVTAVVISLKHKVQPPPAAAAAAAHEDITSHSSIYLN
ncbi:hypothetical protein JOB18_039150 [Solea senegalensis]|uniref:Uncharacterized protein n=1 Tax=Solea senegalensis TaxID=28829 RepID=A0AAV6PWX1_SOLSE|nr:hypothetical protein JOB18_039150 [Solea senegalensis]